MITRFATLTSRMAAALTIMLAIVACGGGGGGGGGGFLGESDGDSTDTYYLAVELTDSEGNPTSIITTNSPGSLRVLVTRNGPNGIPIPDEIVKISTDSGLLIPAEGSKLTDAEGLVTFHIEAGTGKGAGTIVVEVEDENGLIVQEEQTFQVGIDGLRLGYFQDGSFMNGQIGVTPEGTLSASGQAELSVAIVDEDGVLVTSEETVSFSSFCLGSGDADITPDSSVQTSSGQVSAVYSPSSCEGDDVITASLVGTGATASATVNVAAPSAGSLTYVSASPTYIVLKGTGGAPGTSEGGRVEQSTIVFRTTNGSGGPTEGVTVEFKLTTDTGGITLNTNTSVTDADGNASVVVSSGNVPTVVRVIATAMNSEGAEISAVSSQLTISTGLPDQNSITLGVDLSGFVVESASNVFGLTRTITVLLADKFNNPVPDGTQALFRTEFGSIDPSCETGMRNGERLGGTPEHGQCSVQWVSQNPRMPDDIDNQALVNTIFDADYNCSAHNGSRGPCPVELGMIQGMNSTILVTVIGEESFNDRNGNGILDRIEAEEGLFTNLTEAFLDNNRNGLMDPYTTACRNNPDQLTCRAGAEEEIADYNGNEMFDTNGSSAGYPDDGEEPVYNGLLCPREGDIGDSNDPDRPVNPDGWCSRDLLHVWADTVVILGDDTWDIALYNSSGVSPVNSTSYDKSYTAYISDQYNNPPAVGSTVSVTATAPCQVESVTGGSVLNYGRSLAHTVTFTQTGEVDYNSCDESVPSGNDLEGELTITLTPTDGSPAYFESWSCKAGTNDTKEDGPCPDDGDGDGGG